MGKYKLYPGRKQLSNEVTRRGFVERTEKQDLPRVTNKGDLIPVNDANLAMPEIFTESGNSFGFDGGKLN